MLRLGLALRDAQAALLEEMTGDAPWLQYFSGAPPDSAAEPDSGTLLAEVQLPADWLLDPAAGVAAKPLDELWLANVETSGTLGHFRLKDSTKTVCWMQAPITLEGGDDAAQATVLALRYGMVVVVQRFRYIRGNG